MQKFDNEKQKRNLLRVFASNNLQTIFKDLTLAEKNNSRSELWYSVIKQIGSESKVAVLEFGVYEGRSMKFWINNFSNKEASFHGFDSFAGLPENWTPNMPKGKFSTNFKIPDINDSRVKFYVGWVQNTFVPFLMQTEFEIDTPILLHIDTDIYSAALFELAASWHYFNEFYIVFDEFGVDENIAFENFLSAFGGEVIFYSYATNHPSWPAQVFCKYYKQKYTP